MGRLCLEPWGSHFLELILIFISSEEPFHLIFSVVELRNIIIWEYKTNRAEKEYKKEYKKGAEQFLFLDLSCAIIFLMTGIKFKL